MNRSDRVQRWIAFYFSVALYMVLLPIILSYSLGYHIDYRALKVYKTGIIYLKAQPQGAEVYLNGRLVSEETPARIEELRPGTYAVEVTKAGFYPWRKDLVVRPNMVTKAEAIVLFQRSHDIMRVSESEAADFAVSDKGQIFYMAKSGLLRSNLDGTNTKRISSFSGWPQKITGKIFSPDGKTLLLYGDYKIWVLRLDAESAEETGESVHIEEIVVSDALIRDVFWYSRSNYIVFVAGRHINVIELSGRGERNIVTVYTFNQEPKGVWYDSANDSIYFLDAKNGTAGIGGGHVFRIDLRQKFLEQFMHRFTFKKDADIRYEEQ